MAKNAKNEYGQYFTPVDIATSMIQLIESARNSKVLEPSCGEGVFLDALAAQGFTNIQGVEYDDRLCQVTPHKVEIGSFLTWNKTEKFNVVIGNPPYIRWKDLDDDLKNEVKSLSNWNVLFNALTDYLIPFISEGIDRLEENGELIFITPSFWMQTTHSEKLRNWMLQQGSITHVIDFNEATVFPGVSTSIIIFRYVKGFRGETIDFFRYVGKRKVKSGLLELENKDEFDNVQIPGFQVGKHWTLASKTIQSELELLEIACKSSAIPENLFSENNHSTLGDIVDIANGMVSGLDKAFKLSPELVSALNANEREATLQVIKAQNITRGYSGLVTQYIDLPENLSEHDLIENFPNFYSQLLPYKSELLERYSYGREIPFWEWTFKRSEKFFTKNVPKGFVPCKERVTSRDYIRFSLAPVGVVATQDVTSFAPKEGVKESIEYILSFLTLPEVSNWIRHRGLIKGGIAEFSERPLSQVPIRRINWNVDTEIAFHADISERISNLKNTGSKSEDSLKSIHEELRRFIY